MLSNIIFSVFFKFFIICSVFDGTFSHSNEAFISSTSPPDVTAHPNLRLLPETCGETTTSRFDGDRELFYEFPWMALLYYTHGNKTEHRCSGTIINSRYILTSAACLKAVPRFTLSFVRLAEYNLDTNTDCEKVPGSEYCPTDVQNVEIEEVIIHPNYNKTFIRNDIGLIRLKTSIDFTKDDSEPICLPVSREVAMKNLNGENAVLLFWANSFSSFHMKNTMSIRDHQNCTEIYKKHLRGGISHKQLCASILFPQDSHYLQAGSPLQMAITSKGISKNFQYGISSFGPRRLSEHIPDVFTGVVYYMDWILDQLKP